MILAMCKNVGVTPHYVLHETTYENLVLYGYATPVYDSDDKDEFDERIDANDPRLAERLMGGTRKVVNPF